MKKCIIILAALLTGAMQSLAIDDNTVTVVYSGTTATVTVADNIASYVTVSSGTSSDVVLVQNTNFAGVNATDTNTSGEITYILSGSSEKGSFLLTGSYKCTISLAGLSLTNTSGPAMTLLNGKRIKVSAKRETTNTLTGTGTATYNGAFYCKGHVEFQGNGVLNIAGNGYHAVKVKEYVQVKNLTLNITSATKDGINCQEFFWMKSGTVTMSSIGSDGIEVALNGTVSTGEIAATATVDAHEDEDSGNFYQDGGTLTISLASGNTTGALIQATGTESHNGGTYNGTSYDTAIKSAKNGIDGSAPEVYDLNGRRIKSGAKGLHIIKQGNTTTKTITK